MPRPVRQVYNPPGPSTLSTVPRTRTGGDGCWAKVADVASRAKPAAPKARRVIGSIVILPNPRRPINAGHRMNNPPQSCLFQPQQFPGLATQYQRQCSGSQTNFLDGIPKTF